MKSFVKCNFCLKINIQIQNGEIKLDETYFCELIKHILENMDNKMGNFASS